MGKKHSREFKARREAEIQKVLADASISVSGRNPHELQKQAEQAYRKIKNAHLRHEAREARRRITDFLRVSKSLKNEFNLSRLRIWKDISPFMAADFYAEINSFARDFDICRQQPFFDKVRKEHSIADQSPLSVRFLLVTACFRSPNQDPGMYWVKQDSASALPQITHFLLGQNKTPEEGYGYGIHVVEKDVPEHWISIGGHTWNGPMCRDLILVS